MVITTRNINQKPGYKQTEVGVIPEDWEVKKLGEIFEFLITANNSRSDLSESGEIKYIHYGDIHTKWRSFLDCSSNELPLIQRNKVKNVPFLEDGDLVMADASEDYEGIGISVEVKNATGGKVVAGLHTFLLRGNKEVLADGFKGYLQYIPAVKDSLKKAATGISVYGISKNNVRNISICLPSITEQRAIAATLSDVDALIASLDRLIAKKRDIKQATMQQLLIGKARLPGFTGDGNAKLGDFFELNPNKPHLNDTDLVTFIRMEDISESGSILKQSIIPLSSIKNGLTFFERNDVLVAKITPCFENGKGACLDTLETKCGFGSTEFHILRARKNAVSRYIFYQTQLPEFRKRLEAEMIGTAGQKRVPAQAIIDYPLPIYHSRDEQVAIAAILSDMDAEIISLQQRRQKTHALKQGMMQELLTGKTRLL